jgi:soluble lytic murein transglycosylase
MKTKRISLFLIFLLLSTLGCSLNRVLNPDQPQPTETAMVPPTPTNIPTPTPIHTPIPGARIHTGDLALFYGDWELAIQEYVIALESTSENEIKSAALLGLGRTYLQSSRFDAALDALNNGIFNYPDSPHRALMFFTLAQVYEAQGRPLEAVSAYQEYLKLRPGLIDRYIYESIGDSYLETQNYQLAIDAYIQAIDAPSTVDSFYLNLRIADSYYDLGNLTTALVTYEDIYSRTVNDYLKAEAKRKIGDILVSLGNTEEGYLAYQEVVQNYPLAYDAYLSLVALLDAEQTVSELDRGLINYFVGQYGFAVDAFVRYLRAFPDNHADTAHYYLGLSYQKLGEHAKSIEAWQEIIDDHINERYWATAFDEIAFAMFVYQEKPEAAIQVYLDFVDRSPLDEKAPEYLYYAARFAERDFDLKTAARLWERLGSQFSTSSWAFDGLFQAGITRYRLGEYQNSISAFQSSLGVSANPGDQAAAYLWIGKCYQMIGNTGAAEDSWRQASTSDPTGYYSERAKDILENRPPFTPPAQYTLIYNLDLERAEAIAWMHNIFNIPQEENLNDVTPLFSDPRMVRGSELWNLGLYETARQEFESYRNEISLDPGKTFRLANYLTDLGLYRSAVLAARQVLDLAGLDDATTFTAPIYFNHIRFGAYYEDLVGISAAENGLDPLFLYSVLRQESLFEGFVMSTAGARGLMQIIPSTGEEITRQIGWPPNYTAQDLYRPYVNIRFGAYYLDRQRDAFGGDLYQALAAYNGGPGNALKWIQLSNGDPDLFVEVIRFAETRNYIRYIYEIFDIYRDLYGTQ